jgi:probable RcsB/C two-component-system connector
MKSSKDEVLRDALIGEVVLAILNEQAAVSWNAVLTKLQAILNGNHDAERTRLAMLAIQEVKAEMDLKRSKQTITADSFLSVAANSQDDSTRH